MLASGPSDNWIIHGNRHVCCRCGGVWYDSDGRCGCQDEEAPVDPNEASEQKAPSDYPEEMPF